jgi:hypothetical protein
MHPTLKGGREMRNQCTFPGCNRVVNGHGLCKPHYAQWKRGRSPLKPLYATKRATDEAARIRIIHAPCPVADLDGPCHIWAGSVGSHGYGQIGTPNGQRTAHTFMWEQAQGPIPDGMVIDHRCRNRACCNVNHLRLVTPKLNVHENNSSPPAVNANKTHCIRGHIFDVVNTRIEKSGSRRCRICDKEKAQRARLSRLLQSQHLQTE